MTPNKQEDKPAFVKAFEKDQEKTEKILKSFNIDDFTGAPDELRTAEIPKVGDVNFKLLSYAEIEKLSKKLKEENITDLDEQGVYVIAEMMRKADGTTTAEKLKKLPSGITSCILVELSKHSGFL